MDQGSNLTIGQGKKSSRGASQHLKRRLGKRKKKRSGGEGQMGDSEWEKKEHIETKVFTRRN